MVVEMYNTCQGKSESVQVYHQRLKELIGNLENNLVDKLKKRCLLEGLNPSIQKKMKVVPPSTYKKAYDKAMDIESEDKMSRSKKKTSNENSKESEEE